MTIRDVLKDADPVRHEASVLDVERDHLRRAVALGASEPGMPAVTAFRLARAAVIVALVLASIVVALQFWPTGATLQAAVGFEVRLAENQPGPGLREAQI